MADERTWRRREVLAGAAAAWAAAGGAARAAPTPVSFLALGDWGRQGARSQLAVADAMARTAAALDSRFVLSAGDNFYPAGVQSAEDPQWRESFEDIYSAQSLQTPWYAALGNHDYRGKPSAQIAYARTNPRWRMPDRYYRLSAAGHGAADLDIFVLDTTPMSDEPGETLVRWSRGRISTPPDPEQQVAWLDAELARSRAPWKIVVGHHPIRSGGHHGGSASLAARVEPLLERHGVQVYLCGHDHSLQHIRVGRTNHICTGAGSSAGHADPIDGTQFALGAPGFASFTFDATASALTLAFHRADGRRAYEAMVPQG